MAQEERRGSQRSATTPYAIGGPRKAKGGKRTVPASVMIVSDLDGAPSDKRDGGIPKESAGKVRSPRRAMKQAVKEKKGKKLTLLQAQKNEEYQLLNGYIQEGGGQSLAASTVTEEQKKAEKNQRKRGGRAATPDVGGDNNPAKSVISNNLGDSLPSTKDDKSLLSEPAAKRVKAGRKAGTKVGTMTPDAPSVYLAVLNDDQHFTILQEITVAKEEFTPSNPVQGKLTALAELPLNGEDAPHLMVFEGDDPWSYVNVPRMNCRNVTDYYENDDGT